MQFEQSLIQSVVVLVCLIFLVAALRRFGVVKEEHSGLFSRLVIDVTLPALIFLSLARQQFNPDRLSMAGVMMGSEVICLSVAWCVAHLLRLSASRTGSFILASGFASSALLGYALIRQIFPDNAQAMPDAVITGEFGVGTLIFTLGVLIAIHYGSGQVGTRDKVKAMLKFFYSPVFVAMILGILFSVSRIPTDNVVVSTIFHAFNILGQANTVLVVLVIGTLLKVPDLRAVLVIVLAASAIKLLLQPMAAWLPAHWLGFSDLCTKVLVLEAAMPSSVLSAVYARRYGCDAELASLIVFSTLFVSMATLILFLTLLA